MARKAKTKAAPKPIREGTLKALVFNRLGQNRKDAAIIKEVAKKYPTKKFNQNPKNHLAVYKSMYKSRQAA